MRREMTMAHGGNRQGSPAAAAAGRRRAVPRFRRDPRGLRPASGRRHDSGGIARPARAPARTPRRRARHRQRAIARRARRRCSARRVSPPRDCMASNGGSRPARRIVRGVPPAQAAFSRRSPSGSATTGASSSKTRAPASRCTGGARPSARRNASRSCARPSRRRTSRSCAATRVVEARPRGVHKGAALRGILAASAIRRSQAGLRRRRSHGRGRLPRRARRRAGTASRSARSPPRRAIGWLRSTPCTGGSREASRRSRRRRPHEPRRLARPRRHRQLHHLRADRPRGPHRVELPAAPRRRPGVPRAGGRRRRDRARRMGDRACGASSAASRNTSATRRCSSRASTARTARRSKSPISARASSAAGACSGRRRWCAACARSPARRASA